MAQVHGDPEALRALARELRVFTEDLRGQVGRLRSRLADLGHSSWTDERYRAFNEEFENVAHGFDRGCEEIDGEMVTELERLAQHLEDFLSA